MNRLNISIVALGASLAISANAQVYRDVNASVHDRAVSIVSEMTLDEKVSLMKHESPSIPRLGIKQYNWWSEALHGVARAGLATVFPQPIGMAATFDDKLVYDVFVATSDEARAKNQLAKQRGPLSIYQGLTFWTPNVNIFRDPRWGRGHETYGEDPYLTSRMGVSVVRGLQGDSYEGGSNSDKYDKLHACAKHYAVHSGPEWSRHVYNAENISLRDLYETYLPAFKALVKDADGEDLVLNIPVTNTGDVAGTEVVQVYIANPADINGPTMQLRGFQRVELQPGQQANAVIRLTPEQFDWYNPSEGGLSPIIGQCTILYGPSSDIATLKSIDCVR